MLYADYNSTTPPLVDVVAAVTAAMTEDWGNPGARQHVQGRRATALVDRARAAVAAIIGAHDDEVVLTSGATEALNQAILGVGERLLATRPRVVAPATEHHAVLAPLERLAAAGAQVVLVPVDAQGRVDPRQLATAIDERTALVCAMAGNNETGVRHEVAAIAALAHARGALLLCDATQAIGKVPVDAPAWGCDLLALSGHKVYGPGGTGALWIRRGLGIPPLLYGGGQEHGRRSGTPHVAGLAGLAVALELARAALPVRTAHLTALTTRLEDRLTAALPRLHIAGAGAGRLPGTSMITLPGLRRGWLGTLTGVAASGGSACASASGEPSHVLLAMGQSPLDAGNSLRLSLGLPTTLAEVDRIADAVIQGARRLGAA